MKKVNFKNWELIVDKDLTKSTYDKATMGSTDGCVCNECKNFANFRDNTYPNEIKELFNSLGIDYKKEIKTCHYSKEENGLHFYGGSFQFKGHFIGKDCEIPLDDTEYTFDLTPITENFSIGFRKANQFTLLGESIVQIEIETKIPWSIDKELESE